MSAMPRCTPLPGDPSSWSPQGWAPTVGGQGSGESPPSQTGMQQGAEHCTLAAAGGCNCVAARAISLNIACHMLFFVVVVFLVGFFLFWLEKYWRIAHNKVVVLVQTSPAPCSRRAPWLRGAGRGSIPPRSGAVLGAGLCPSAAPTECWGALHKPVNCFDFLDPPCGSDLSRHR